MRPSHCAGAAPPTNKCSMTRRICRCGVCPRSTADKTSPPRHTYTQTHTHIHAAGATFTLCRIGAAPQHAAHSLGPLLRPPAALHSARSLRGGAERTESASVHRGGSARGEQRQTARHAARSHVPRRYSTRHTAATVVANALRRSDVTTVH